jgi:anti-sigma factor ChrR (cupin superfamily)
MSQPGRTNVNARTTPYLEYDLEGPVQPELSWLPLSFDRETQQGTYLMRMQPGAVTIAHDHPGMEEFLILEGDLVDSDGTVFGPGDFVSYEAGTHHKPLDGGRLPPRGLRVEALTTAQPREPIATPAKRWL